MRRKFTRIGPILVTLALAASPGIVLAQTTTDRNASTMSASSDQSVPPDNSGRNVRDRAPNAVTPFTQSSNHTDFEITRRIRRALVKDKSLSMMAKNVKVITVDGTVTLRGPVKSEHEKATIADEATQIAGPGNVTNLLEVAGR
jgi:hyperosmotically inducible periplasmic protein